MMDIEDEIKILVEPDIWESKTQFSNLEKQRTEYGKLPIQSLNPLMYKHSKLYYENTVIGLMKASNYDGYVEGRNSLEAELQQAQAEKAELVRQCEEIAVLHAYPPYKKSCSDAILSLLPKGE